MRVRQVLLSLLTVIVFASCAGEEILNEPMPLASIPTVNTTEPQELVFLVDTLADQTINDAAASFVEHISSLTDGRLTIELRRSADPVSDYLAGNGQMVLIDSRNNAEFSEDFKILSSPMRYAGYEEFTMALNSHRMLEALNERTIRERGTRLLAAYYNGSSVFLSSQPLSDGNIAELRWEEYDAGGEEDGTIRMIQTYVPAEIQSGEELEQLLYDCGIEADSIPAPDVRLEGLESGRTNLAEFTVGELNAIDWQDAHFNIIAIGHTAAPLWLAVRDENYQELSEFYSAAIQEAAAYLFPAVDGAYRDQEDKLLESLLAQGFTVDRRFTGLQNAAESRDKNTSASNPHLNYLLGLLTGMN